MKFDASNAPYIIHCLGYVLEGNFNTEALLHVSKNTLTAIHRELTEYVACTAALALTTDDVKKIWCSYITRAVDNGTIINAALTATDHSDVTIKDFARELLCKQIMAL